MNWINDHGVALLAAYYVFSAIVSGMPEPPANAGVAYRWVFHSAHILAGDLSQVIGSRVSNP